MMLCEKSSNSGLNLIQETNWEQLESIDKLTAEI